MSADKVEPMAGFDARMVLARQRAFRLLTVLISDLADLSWNRGRPLPVEQRTGDVDEQNTSLWRHESRWFHGSREP
jgi:hypothetical protein